jgi:hypothetical protein
VRNGHRFVNRTTIWEFEKRTYIWGPKWMLIWVLTLFWDNDISGCWFESWSWSECIMYKRVSGYNSWNNYLKMKKKNIASTDIIISKQDQDSNQPPLISLSQNKVRTQISIHWYHYLKTRSDLMLFSNMV